MLLRARLSLRELTVRGGENLTNCSLTSSQRPIAGIVKPTSEQGKIVLNDAEDVCLDNAKACLCLLSGVGAVNPAYIPGPDINTVLESRGARLAVMLEESSLCSTLLMKGEGGCEGAGVHTRSAGFPPLYWISVPARPGQKKNK